MIRPGLFADRLQVSRRTTVEDDYGTHDIWADHGDPLPAKVEAQTSYEDVTGRDTTVGFWQALIPGQPDLKPDDHVRDQHGRTFTVEGELAYQQNPSGSLQLTIARLRAATNL